MPLTPHQQEAIKIATSGRVGLLTGGPGSGKTFAISNYLHQCPKKRVLLCAPTGKAAIRMNESLGMQIATTVHRMLEPVPTPYGWQFQKGPDNPLDADLIIGDEWSMMNSRLFAQVLQAVPLMCQLLLVGDPDQLPPVGHGKPLLDMIRSKTIPHGHLSEPHRFAGRIASVCHQIKNGESPTFSEAINLGAKPPENIVNIPVGSERRAIGQILDLFDRLPLKYGFDSLEDIQVIVPRNGKTPFNREMFNHELKKKLNGNAPILKEHPYSVDDKVMNLRNFAWPAVEEDWDMEEDDDVEDQFGVSEDGKFYVANGEIGRIFHATEKFVWVRFDHDRLCHYSKRQFGNLTHAYAITGHKSQGSQWKSVIVVLEEPKNASFLGNRSWIYTAISRAAEHCIVFGRPAWIRSYISRESTVKRKTLLMERLCAH